MAGPMRHHADEVFEAISDGVQRFKRTFRDRQRDQADGIRKRDDEIKKLEDDLIAANSPTRPSNTDTRRGPNESRGDYGERMTDARMQELGYERISPDKNSNANGVDGIYINTDTGHVAIVEAKYGTSRLGQTQHSGEQMSETWLTSPVRPGGSNSRIDDAMTGVDDVMADALDGLDGLDITEGLDLGIVSRVVTQVDGTGNVTINVLGG